MKSQTANRKSQIPWILGGLLFFCLVFCHQKKFDSATPVSRLDLLHALWQQHTVCIDAYHSNTPDKAVFQGHYYSDKAPGTVVVALPAFALSTQILKLAKVPLDSKTGWLVSSWIACAGSIALITALGGVALFAWLCHFVPARAALVAVLALFLGAAPLSYSTMMFSHAMVIGLICIAMWALRIGVEHEEREERDERGERMAKPRYGLAGFCCGLALASEFSCGIIVVAVFLWLLFTTSRTSRPNLSRDLNRNLNLPLDPRACPASPAASLPAVASPTNPPIQKSTDPARDPPIRKSINPRFSPVWRFALAALPPLVLVPAYSWLCFGTPFTLAYTHQASFPEMSRGLYAIQWPDPLTAWNLLFPPTRGLFFWTPFLLMAGIGYWTMSAKSARLFLLTYAVPLLHVIVVSGRTWDWPAGPVLGPRLLAPMLPLLALPCALGVQRWPRLGAVLAAYSISITVLATVTDAVVAASYYNPLTEVHIPLLLEGEFCPNLGTVLGLQGYVSVGLLSTSITSAAWLLQRQPKGRPIQPPDNL